MDANIVDKVQARDFGNYMDKSQAKSPYGNYY